MELKNEVISLDSKDELKEVKRLRFILDKQNRYPMCLDDTEERRLMARLTKLERKYSIRY